MSRTKPHSLTITHFDTFDWRLYEKGISVAVENSSPDDTVLFVDPSGAAERIPGNLPTGFSDDLPEGRVHNRLSKIIDVRRLLPLADILTHRTVFTIRDGDEKIIARLCWDDMSARRHRGRKTFDMGCEVTLAPVRGYDKEAKSATVLLKKHYRQPGAPLPQHRRAFELLGMTPGDYSSRLRLKLAPDMTSLDAVRTIHLNLLDTMTRNEAGTMKNIDAEFLHDFRVAVRRTRSALSQLDKGILADPDIAAAKANFKWVGQQTNQMRDLDVYLIDYPKLQASLPAAYQSHLFPFRAYLQNQGKKEARKVAGMIRGQRYKKIRDDWKAYLNGELDAAYGKAARPIKPEADAKIWKTYKRVMKEGNAIDDTSPAAALHNLRITCKKLRYLLEFFQSIYPPKKIQSVIKTLKQFQDVLGTFQDTEIQSAALLQFGRDMANAGDAPVETQMAMGMIAESLLKHQQEARHQFQDRFEAFAQPGVRQMCAALFQQN